MNDQCCPKAEWVCVQTPAGKMQWCLCAGHVSLLHDSSFSTAEHCFKRGKPYTVISWKQQHMIMDELVTESCTYYIAL